MRGVSLNKLIPSCFSGGARSKSKKSTSETNPEANLQITPKKGILKKPNEALKSSGEAGTSGAAHGSPDSDSSKSKGKALAFSPSAEVPGQDSPISLRSPRVRIDENKNTVKTFKKSKAEAKEQAKEHARVEKAVRDDRILKRLSRLEKAMNDGRW